MSAESDFLYSCIIPFFYDDPMIASYHQYSQGSYDTTTGEYTTVQVDTPMKAILLDFDRTSNGLSSKFGTMVMEGDKEVYLLPTQKADSLATPIVPNPTSDRITVAGITYKIVVSKSADPTGTNPLLYNLMLRR